MRTSFRAAAAVMVVAVASLTACTPPTTGGGTNYATCPSAGAGEVRVAVVVDATGLGSTAPTVTCVVVAQGATGVTALYARAARLGTTPPRFDTSGLVCAIDGAPVAPACGEVGPNGYQYWSYWIGGSSWTFAPVGPASRSMQDGTVEGWRFLPGGASVSPGTSSIFTRLVA